MLKITVQKSASLTTLKLEGRIVREWIDELERAWLAARDRTSPTKVDLSEVRFVDEEGKKVLGRIFEQGATLHATDCMNRFIIEEIRRRHHPHRAPHSLLTKLIAATIIVCSARVVVRGQEAPPLRLTLREAIQTALKQNPEVVLANSNLATRHQNSPGARSALLSQASMSASTWRVYRARPSRIRASHRSVLGVSGWQGCKGCAPT